MKQVLIVDDVPEVRAVLRTVIEGSDVEVLEAGDGQQALEAVKRGGVDLIVTDCKMPNMSGLELIEAARAAFPEMPFIVVSSTAEERDFRHLKPCAVMSKPFRLNELMAAVQAALGQK